jgi:hypothetical protein
MPLDVVDAVKYAVDAIELFEHHNINIAKVGLHSDLRKEDVVTRPFHPAFGELVRAEKINRKLQTLDISLLDTIFFSEKDISVIKGHGKTQLLEVMDMIKKYKITIGYKQNIKKGCFITKNKEVL